MERWSCCCICGSTGRADLLRIRTHQGRIAFANPTFTHITASNGAPAIAVTLYVPGSGSAPGEAVYYKTPR